SLTADASPNELPRVRTARCINREGFCMQGRYISLDRPLASPVLFISPTTPTIESGKFMDSGIQYRSRPCGNRRTSLFPIGLSPAQNDFARDLLTITTPRVSSESELSKYRPSTRGILSVRK